MIEAPAGTAAVDLLEEDLDSRPTERLPLGQLFQISLYWLGINTIWGGIGVVVQERVPALVAAGEAGRFLALQSVVTMAMAILIQPTVGSISDYTISRWGRRKPYIAIGAALDVVFLIGIATSNTYLSLVAFLVLLQFSSNFAQGPFQGYVPDLVPPAQVGMASALVGVMQTLGFIAGGLIITLGYVLGDFTLPIIALGIVEGATALGTLLWVREGRRARDRRGRSWLAIARSAWGTDVLRERSFVWLVLSRLMFLAGINMLLGLYILFMSRALGLTNDDKALWVPVTQLVVAVLTVIASVPSARISDRIGRKPVIYVACAIGAVGMAIAAIAPSIQVFVLGAILMGVASGTFLAVDWALMTDIIPKAASGRYMGISNIAVASGGPVATIIGGLLIDAVGGPAETGDGPRAAFAAGIVLFILAGVFLRRVDPRPRDVRLADERAMAELAGATGSA
ncbi:MAG TPA: MFS transporter [Candidatus Eisenbacteria bacterium]|nr:MFS transporter [Candidatus Eisenbacteria bacterium]